jgi:hypothetical protein
MLSLKLLVDVSVDTFAGKNHYQRKSTPQSTCITSFHPLAVTPGPCCHLEAFFHLKNEALTGAGARADLVETYLPRKAFSDELAASDITS